MTTVYVSLGSNIDREHNLRGALDALLGQFGEVRSSSVYETDAVGFAGTPFFNLVSCFESDRPALEINRFLKQIEDCFGRDRSSAKFSARTLDIDLLLYGDRVLSIEELNLPRDEISKYAFVLEPLAELAPAMRYPGHLVTFAELWSEKCRHGQMRAAQRVDWQP